ncbi:MAG: portal protein [Candidatus Omnitrophota bacterium]|nr:portal protein [Candidatus Omnitrophota bacterium]
MATSVVQLLKRWQELKAEYLQYADLQQEIAERVIPHRSNITRLLSPGERQTRELFDSTAIDSAQTLAASIHGTMTPSTQPWMSFALRQEELNDLPEVKDWSEDNARRIHAALRQSNWTTAVHEMYLDLVGPAAMGCLFVEEKAPTRQGGFGGFRFMAQAPGSYFVAEDAEGRIDTVFRELSLSARAILAKWGDKKVGDKIRETVATKPDQRFTIVQAVMPNQDYGREAGRRGRLNMAWSSCYFIVETRHKVEEGGFEEFPFLCPRWAKTSGEVYGRGPSHTALPDIKTLNAVKEFLLKAAPLAMFPPTVELDDSVVGEVDLRPYGRNVVSVMGNRSLSETFAFMQTGLKIDISQIILQDLRAGIRRIYFSDQLELQEGPQMTATEVQVRYELMQRLLGPTLGRLESEFLNPLVERCFGIMARAQALLPLPQVLLEQGLELPDLDIEYEGPLARAQRTVELTAQDRVLAFVAGLTQAMVAAGVPPTQAAAVWDVLKADKWVRDRAEITGVRTDSLASQEEVDTLRQARAQVQQAETERMQMMQGAEAAGKAAPMVKELSAAAMAGQNGGGR